MICIKGSVYISTYTIIIGQSVFTTEVGCDTVFCGFYTCFAQSTAFGGSWWWISGWQVSRRGVPQDTSAFSFCTTAFKLFIIRVAWLHWCFSSLSMLSDVIFNLPYLFRSITFNNSRMNQCELWIAKQWSHVTYLILDDLGKFNGTACTSWFSE